MRAKEWRDKQSKAATKRYKDPRERKRASEKAKERWAREKIEKPARQATWTLSDKSRWRKYKLDPEACKKLFTNQEGKCAICKKVFGDGKHGFAVDHDHTIGVVRGLLCVPCNASLGWYEKWATQAQLYLGCKPRELEFKKAKEKWVRGERVNWTQSDFARWKRYRVTPEIYKTMWDKQQGKCAICAIHLKDSGYTMDLAIDHNHTTGSIRGLLCNKCNLSLGWYERWLDAAYLYLNSANRSYELDKNNDL
jgi:Recombination endonuclease VII